jgi:hypothetical protein
VVKKWCIYPGEGALVVKVTADGFQLAANMYGLFSRGAGNANPKRKSWRYQGDDLLEQGGGNRAAVICIGTPEHGVQQ